MLLSEVVAREKSRGPRPVKVTSLASSKAPTTAAVTDYFSDD